MNDSPFEPRDFRVLLTQSRWHGVTILRYPWTRLGKQEELRQRAVRWLSREHLNNVEHVLTQAIQYTEQGEQFPDIRCSATIYTFTEEQLVEFVQSVRADERDKSLGQLNLEVPLDAELHALRAELAGIIGAARERVAERHRELLNATPSLES